MTNLDLNLIVILVILLMEIGMALTQLIMVILMQVSLRPIFYYLKVGLS